MRMKSLWSALWGAALATTLAVTLALPASASRLNARVVGVDPSAHTITTIEARKPFVFTVTERTRFVDAKGKLLAVGLKFHDVDVLTLARQKGYLKSGSRLSIVFEQQGNYLIASQVQFRDVTRQHDKREHQEENQGEAQNGDHE